MTKKNEQKQANISPDQEKIDQDTIVLKERDFISFLEKSYDLRARSKEHIDVFDLMSAVWDQRRIVCGVTVIFFLFALFYSLMLNNTYKAEIILTASKSDQQVGIGGIMSEYSGLAALAGVSLGGQDSGRLEQAVALMNSWPFLEDVVEKNNLKHKIMAVQKWENENQKFVYSNDLYDPRSKSWYKNSEGESLEPSSWDTYKVLSNIYSARFDPKTGFVTISFEHQSPVFAYEFVMLITNEINLFYKTLDKNESEKSIAYLKNEVDKTSVSEFKTSLYELIESQVKTLMLTEISDQYLMKTVVPAKIPERKYAPRRSVIVVIGTALGFVLSLIVIAIRFKGDNPS